MPQGALAANVAKQGTSLVPLNVDTSGSMQVQSGGSKSTLNISAAAVIKASPGRLRRIIVQTVGTAGNWVFNDLTTTSGAAAANQVATIAYNASGLVAGVPVVFDWPFQTGIVISAVPTGGVIAVAYD
jgi:hypothetical protein